MGILCFRTKAQSMQLIWAPESMIAVVSTSFIVRGETINFILMYKEFFHRRVLWIIVGHSCVEVVSLSKILVICFLWSGELSNDSILIFFSYFFDRSSSFNYGYLFGWGASRGMGRERGRVCESGAGRGHVAFLPAAETAPFFETSFSFLWGKFAGFFLGVYVHGIGIPGGSAPSGGRGVECNGSSG